MLNPLYERTMLQRRASVRKKLLVYGAPAIEDTEIEEVVAVMQSGWLGTGPR